MINKQTVLSFFKDKIKKPLGFKQLIQLMKLDKAEAYSLKKVLKRMLKDGDILLTRNGLYIIGGEVNLLTGYFEAHRDGYGFVILEKPGERDIFVPARSTLGAMDSDRVIVRVENWARRDGTIIRILKRAHTKIAGKLDITKTAVYVRPKSRSIPFDLLITNKDVGKAKDGDLVIAEITSYPFEKRPPSGKILKIIKKPEDPSEEVESIIDEFNISRHFPKDVNDEAKLLVNKSIKNLDTRKDLRQLPTVTIDGERAKDFDDAVSIKLTENGYRLWVHIADVSFYVSWDSVIDLEARKRATSIYFPDRVTPMLPGELSEDICSLRPNVDRLAFTVEIDFDRLGNKLNSRFYPSIIKSFERMTYTSVKKILTDNDEDERRRYSSLVPHFELMGELCGILREKRLKRGSLDFDLPEPEVILDMQGSPEAIIRSERNFAHMLIEEFMISANESVAEYISKLKIPSIYRIHEEPDSMKLEEIIRVVKPILKNKIISKAKDFSFILNEIKGRPEEEIVNYMVLRSLKQARYSAVNVGHFGLASECYTHFTSPIRRYPDLVVHRILRELLESKQLGDKRIKELESLLPDIAFHCSLMERRADDSEHEVMDAMRAWFMKDKVGSEFEGKIVNITPYGLKIRLKDFYVDGFLHLSSMTDDFYEFNERNMTLYGKNTKRSYTIGKELSVRIDKVDIDEREITFGV